MMLRIYIPLLYLLGLIGTGGSHAEFLRGIPEQASDVLQRELVVSSPSCYEVDKNCDGVDFTLLIGASLWHSTLNDASFVDTNWQGIGFGGSQAKNTDFTRANLRDASVNHVRFDNAVLREADLSGANFDSTCFTGADLTSATYSPETNFARASFDPATKFPDGNTWLDTNFFTTDIKGMKLILDDQVVSGMDLSSRFSSLQSCSFSRMTAHGTSFQGCDLSESSMWQLQAEAIDFSNTVLTNIRMDYSNIRGVNFRGAVLTNTGLKNCKMEDCNLVGADLSQAVFDDSTKMLGCTYDATTLFPEDFDPLTHGLIDIYAPTGSPTLAPMTSSPTFSATMPNLEDLMNNTMTFDNIPCFPMGINLASVLYYSNQFTFKNSFLESGACCWPADTRVDADGNLLEVAHADSTDYWIAGRNLIYRVGGQYPGGTYILHLAGNGTVNLAFDVGASQDVSSEDIGPNGHAVDVTPSDGGVQLTIIETSETDPVRNISFMYQEYQDDSISSAFTPTFMDTLSGMNVLRFMDMGRTNGNNIGHWEDRNTKMSVSQSRSIKRVWDIDSVNIPAEQMPFTDIFGLKIITIEPHGLITGQGVTIENLEGQVVVSREGDSDLIRDLSEVWFPKLVEVTGNNTFLINIGNWDWDKSTYSLSAISSASADRVLLEINPGVAYEYMIEMSKESGADPWFCVPHLATDDYVKEMAELIVTSVLGPDVTVYVELSNEVWNSMFSQQWYAEAKRRQLNLSSSSQYHGQRSKEVFEIFKAAFAAVPNAPVLNRVLATQSVSTWVSDQVIIAAGGARSFDSLAVAPYFSAHATDVFGRSFDGQSLAGVTVTDVLELCLEDIFGDNRRYVIAQKEVAEYFGGTLVAYEGGQHLGGQGNHPFQSIRLEDDSAFQDLMIAANRDPRMHNLYQAYFRQWGELAGGVFAHFSFIGRPSKWGSWGVKESYYKADTVEDSPKWVSVKGIADRCGAS